MGSSPKAPPPPDPKATAQAQASANVATATANARLNNADEEGPLGSVRYEVVGYENQSDGLGGTIAVPKYKRIETLSPEQQKLYDQQTNIGYKMNDLAGSQIDRLDKTLSEPINTDGLPEAVGDFSAYQKQVEDALYSRLNPQLDRERSNLEASLINQGLQRGTAAFDTAMGQYGQQANDARTSVLLASGQEARDQAAAQGTARERAFQERMAIRQAPINEITALMSGGQVTMPQFTPYRASNIADTPYQDSVYKSYQGQLDAWKTQTAQNTAMKNGLFSLGGSIAGGLFKLSDARVKTEVKYERTLPSGINVYSYRYLWSDKREEGVIAQEVQKVAPEAVNDDGLYLTVDYSKVA